MIHEPKVLRFVEAHIKVREKQFEEKPKTGDEIKYLDRFFKIVDVQEGLYNSDSILKLILKEY